MIKNERQFLLASAQIQKLKRAECDIESRERPHNEHPRRKRLEFNAIHGELGKLSAEVAEYRDLRSGRIVPSPVRDLADLPSALIRQRIASGLTQRDLAKHLGVAEQQVQRDEANDYVSASLDRLSRVATALGLTVDIPLKGPVVMPTTDALERQLVAAGLDKPFIRRRLQSKTAQTRAVSDAATPTLDFAGRLARIFGWNASTILSGGVLSLPTRTLATAYKRPATSSNTRLMTLTSYAEYCARLIIAATQQSVHDVPRDPQAVRDQLKTDGRPISFQTILEWTWDMGIAVFPLNEPGGFHALVMREPSRRTVVVLKQRDQARWAFDLLHEIGHLARNPAGELLRIDENAPEDEMEDIEEREASRFASIVLLGPDADEISDEAIENAHGSLPLLKASVRQTAAKRNVPLGPLALHTAYRLSGEGQPGFWGAAVNLAAERDEKNQSRASDALFSRLDWSRLNEIDHDILLQALSE